MFVDIYIYRNWNRYINTDYYYEDHMDLNMVNNVEMYSDNPTDIL